MAGVLPGESPGTMIFERITGAIGYIMGRKGMHLQRTKGEKNFQHFLINLLYFKIDSKIQFGGNFFIRSLPKIIFARSEMFEELMKWLDEKMKKTFR